MGPAGDCGEHDFGSGDRKVAAMVFTYAEGLDAHLVGEDGFLNDVAQHVRVVVEPRKNVTGAPRRGVDREARRERHRTLFEPLHAEQFVAKRFVRARRRRVP